ncbi:hypothetical protein E2320_019082 [Naja naja]|nr:hypothetical protein E2320_019082 [Naja naja]
MSFSLSSLVRMEIEKTMRRNSLEQCYSTKMGINSSKQQLKNVSCDRRQWEGRSERVDRDTNCCECISSYIRENIPMEMK